eukprot:7778023-Lingulodinium_polyedra.AAC.1
MYLAARPAGDLNSALKLQSLSNMAMCFWSSVSAWMCWYRSGTRMQAGFRKSSPAHTSAEAAVL